MYYEEPSIVNKNVERSRKSHTTSTQIGRRLTRMMINPKRVIRNPENNSFLNTFRPRGQ